ncbi:hypothetical protein HDU80_009318 [Chytriomyces hyalinus]|nr:hypothetical protein HDU80_009318 [Chytriomyces hyalinus]
MSTRSPTTTSTSSTASTSTIGTTVLTSTTTLSLTVSSTSSTSSTRSTTSTTTTARTSSSSAAISLSPPPSPSPASFSVSDAAAPLPPDGPATIITSPSPAPPPSPSPTSRALPSISPTSPSPVVVVLPSSAAANPTTRQTANQVSTIQSAINAPTTVRAPLPSTTAAATAVSSANANTNDNPISARPTVNTIRTDLIPTFSQQSQEEILPDDGSAGGTARPQPVTTTRSRTTTTASRRPVTTSSDFWGRFSSLGGIDEVDPLIDPTSSANGTDSATGTRTLSSTSLETSTSTGKSLVSSTRSAASTMGGSGVFTTTGNSGASNASAGGSSVVAPILGAFGGAIAVGLVAMLIMWIIGRQKKKTNNNGPGSYVENKPTVPNTNAEPAATEPFLQAGAAQPASFMNLGAMNHSLLDTLNIPNRTLKKVGRKRDDSAPANKRIALNRENQRNYRERQLQRLALLETKAKEAAELLVSRDAEICILRLGMADLQQRLLETSPAATAGSVPAHCSICTVKDALITSLQNELKALRSQSALGDQFQRTLQAQQSPSIRSTASASLGTVEPSPFSLSASEASGAHSVQGYDTGATYSASTSQARKPTPPVQSGPTTPQTTLSEPTLSEEWFDIMSHELDQTVQTSEQMYGPIKVEFMRYSFKRVPSLANCEHVDSLIENITLQTRMASVPKIKILMVRILDVWQLVLDACKGNPVDMNQANEIFFAFQELNAEHLRYLSSVTAKYGIPQVLPANGSQSGAHSVSRGSASSESSHIPLQALELCQQLRSIPSLTNAGDSIDELYALLCSTDIQELYVKTGAVVSRLHRMCSGYQDRAEFLKQMMRYKETNKASGIVKVENTMRYFGGMSIGNNY